MKNLLGAAALITLTFACFFLHDVQAYHNVSGLLFGYSVVLMGLSALSNINERYSNNVRFNSTGDEGSGGRKRNCDGNA